MLEYLRKNASSFFSKVLLGAIALIFAIYFGFQGGGNPLTGSAPIAKVNGESIPTGLFNQSVQRQLAFYQQLGQNNDSADFQKLIQSQVLQGLVANVLFSQEARSWGLRITDAELAQAIRSIPGLQQNGRFNEEYYLKSYKPQYQYETGQDFEFTLREELLQERFREVLDQASVVSKQQVMDSLLAKDTQLKIQQLEVPFGTGEEGSLDLKQAQTIAGEWIQAKKENKGTQKILEESSLKEIEVGPQSLQALQALYGGPSSFPILSCLLELQPGQVCEEAFELPKKVVALKLVERQIAEPEKKDILQMNQQIATATKNQILTRARDLLTKDAKIETFLQR